jgi:hypothetical protein
MQPAMQPESQPRPLTSYEKSKIILMWKKNISVSAIASEIKISYNRTYDCILKHRVKNGDKKAEAILARLRAGRSRCRRNSIKKNINGQEVTEVELYRCPTCKNLVIFSPCVVCLIREKNSAEKFIPPKIWNPDEKISYELSPEEDARRQEIHDRVFRNRIA